MARPSSLLPAFLPPFFPAFLPPFLRRLLRVLSGCLPLLGWVAGCSVGPIEISDQPLAGKIGGADWVLGSAETNAILSANFSTYFAAAYGNALAPCTGAGSAA